MNVYFKSGKVSRSWNYRPPLVDQFLERLPQAEFSLYQPEKALLLVENAGAGGPSAENFPDWPAYLELSLASVPNEGVWVDEAVLLFLWKSVNAQHQVPPGFRVGSQYYIVGLEIPGVSMKDVPFNCW